MLWRNWPTQWTSWWKATRRKMSKFMRWKWLPTLWPTSIPPMVSHRTRFITYSHLMIHRFRFLQNRRLRHHPAVPELQIRGSAKRDGAAGRRTGAEQWVLPAAPTPARHPSPTDRADVGRVGSVQPRVSRHLLHRAKLRAGHARLHRHGRPRMSAVADSVARSGETHHQVDVPHQLVLAGVAASPPWPRAAQRRREDGGNARAEGRVQHATGANAVGPRQPGGERRSRRAMPQRVAEVEGEVRRDRHARKWKGGMSSKLHSENFMLRLILLASSNDLERDARFLFVIARKR